MTCHGIFLQNLEMQRSIEKADFCPFTVLVSFLGSSCWAPRTAHNGKRAKGLPGTGNGRQGQEPFRQLQGSFYR